MALTDREASQILYGDTGIPRVPWESHYEWLDQNHEAGHHVSVFAPNDGGKTHLIRRGHMPLWKRYPVLIIQFKRRDPAMAGWGREVRHFPTWQDRLPYELRGVDSPKWEQDPEWFRLRLPAYRWDPNPRHPNESYRRARLEAGRALDRAYRQGGWVVVVDETRALADVEQPALGLRAPMENIWQRGRTEPVTLYAATQQPAHAPSSMYDQPHHVYLGRTLDVGRHRRLGEIGGDTEQIAATLPSLEQYEFLYVHRPSGRMEIVKAPDPLHRTGSV